MKHSGKEVRLMKVKYSKTALKFLKKLDKKSLLRITMAIEGLKEDPPRGDIKQMRGYQDDRKRLRVGDWRIIYRYDFEQQLVIIYVIDIGNRGDIYK
jgi:mRNA interferase RelE/StbE